MTDYKVASILDNRRLVINAGSDNGVSRGDQFMIYDSKGKEIIDPDTKEVLGQLDISKMPVKVILVKQKYCVAETYRFKEVNEGGNFSGMGSLSNYISVPKIKREYDTFEIEKSTRREIDESKSIIKIGDLARRIISEIDPL